jgi:hypothetical protein
MCAYCNNTRSQPFDRAYDEFIEWIIENEQKVLGERRIVLEEVFGPRRAEKAEDVLRFFVKQICCRLAECIRTDTGEALLPPDALAFLDGTAQLRSITTEMWIEPSWLRFDELGAGDPDWISILGHEAVHPGPEMRLGSRWNYGWLVLGWECWGEEEGNVFLGGEEINLPIVSTRPAAFELAFAPTTAKRDQDGNPDEAWLSRITGGSPVEMDTLARSPVSEKFIAGALDTEAGLRDRSPDRREFFVAEPYADPRLEVMRVSWLCGVARSIWAEGSLGVEAIRSVALRDRLLDPALLKREALALGDVGPDSGWPGITSGFAAMASLKLVEAHQRGIDTREGEDALLAAAWLAGAAAAAAAAWQGDHLAGWDAVHSALAVVAALEAELASAGI